MLANSKTKNHQQRQPLQALPDFPERSSATDLAARDLMRQVSETIEPRLCFSLSETKPNYVTMAPHPHLPELRYFIQRRPGNSHVATAQLQNCGGGMDITLLYQGTDAGDAIAWCRLHSIWGVQKASRISFPANLTLAWRAASAGFQVRNEAPHSGNWRLLAPDGTDIGTWDNPVQATIVARSHLELTEESQAR